MASVKRLVQKNISNIPGWRTQRKIVVIESDDWGSVRLFSREARDKMKAFGLNTDATHYDTVDSLESNRDLELFFDFLSQFKDKNGRNPVITAMCNTGNPDFEKIVASGFEQYFFQALHESLAEYPAHDKVLELWRKGTEEHYFVPEIHGREHVNVRRYMAILQQHPAKEGLRFAAQHKSLGPYAYRNQPYPNYLGALHPERRAEIAELQQHLIQSGSLFQTYNGYRPRAFIAPNAEEPKELEKTLHQIGVKYLTRSKKRIYPKGDGVFEKEWNFIGKRTEFNQIVINRNAFFEPVCWGEQEHVTDWVDHCLKDMENAFFWKKPAVICSHRVNYVGFIEEANRAKGLKALGILLTRMLQKWPDIEFMSTAELGDTIRQSQNEA